MTESFDQKKPHHFEESVDKLMEVFCDVYDFCSVFIPEREKMLLTSGTRKRQRAD